MSVSSGSAGRSELAKKHATAAHEHSEKAQQHSTSAHKH
jgi:hypothetical protein